MMRQIFFVLCTICIASSAASSQALSDKIQPVLSPAPPKASEDFTIGPEDVLQIAVWHEPELTNSKAVVRPDGKIGVALLGDIQASGLTTEQLKQTLTLKWARYVAKPEVSVVVLEIHSQTVHVMGSVARPGAYILGGPLTVVELLARAGGLAEGAKPAQIAIMRSKAGQTERIPFNYKAFMKGEKMQSNIQLKNGDLVVVP
jgi:polysaccharide export outer membrane protein